MTEEGWYPMVWVPDSYWIKLTEPKRCRRIDGSPKTHCPNMADFGFPRSNGVWAYCEEHMYGRRIRDGIVEMPVHPDSPAAQKHNKLESIPGHSVEAGLEICRQLNIDPVRVLSISILALHGTLVVKTSDGDVNCHLVPEKNKDDQVVFRIVKD